MILSNSLSPSLRLCAHILSLLALLAASAPSLAQDAPPPSLLERKLVVGITESPPFVMNEKGHLTGLSIELWQRIAGELDLRWDYKRYDSFRGLVDAAAEGDIDIAVTNLSVTEGRARRIEFTQPWFDGGLRILTSSEQGASFRDVLAGLNESGFLRVYALIGLMILAATIVTTLFYRRYDPDFPSRWRDGFAESFYNVMTVATSGKLVPGRNFFGWVGRIFQGIWLLAGVALIAYVTSSITSVMTTLSLTNQIRSLDDLPGRTVAVLSDSVGEDFAQEAGLRYRRYKTIGDASDALLNGGVNAVIADTGVLEYYVLTHTDKPLEVVGRIFEPDKYAFGLPRGSALRRPLTLKILEAREDDEIEALRLKYFGEET
ncbi:Glutamine-binding periplasmic protein precursor [Methyloligella halotolerans]|uniref:Glutamine-binding periplasmic protein n=2 Tax=Methyloligella halotolerans TaxID=1177755 RepID=A0A1E2RYW3_9HYPH|nr:Glutamine-binding periplasmic protein precursor [Methyloligella halotolerans]